MKQLVVNFPQQLADAIAIGNKHSFKTKKNNFQNIVLSGLGGSGIGGSITQNYIADSCSIPFIVNKDYFLPGFINEKSLVLISSYSGNTEETLAAMQQAIKMKATVICITSGGKVQELAKKHNLDCVIIPSGMPPRSCLGYSMVQVLYVLHHLGYVKKSFEKDLKASIDLLKKEAKAIQKEAKTVAKKLVNKMPIVYAAADFEGVAVRFRQQINENGKMLCWHHVIPEMNHNELVGWRKKDPNQAVVLLRNTTDYKRTQMRMEINKEVFKKYTKTIIEIHSKGKSYLERAFYLIHLTDFVSVDLAELNKLDPTEVKVIDYLKGALAKSK